MIPGRLIYEIIKEMILSTVYEIGPLCLLFLASQMDVEVEVKC